MTVSPLREVFFLFCSLLFGGAAALVYGAVPLLFGGDGEKKERTRLYGKLPYPPSRRKKEGQRKTEGKVGRMGKGALRILGDVSFFLLFSVFYCILVYAAHDGAVRLYSLAAVVLGFFGARRLLRRPFALLSRLVFAPLREGVFFCLLWGFYPFRVLVWGMGRGIFILCAKIRAPFSLLCGILSKKIGEKRSERQKRQASHAREARRAVGHPLTSARIPSVKEDARGKGKV